MRVGGLYRCWPRQERLALPVAAPGMAADPLLASYLQITEETDRLMGFSQPRPEPLQPPVPEPQPAVAAVPRRRVRRKPQLGPGRRAQLASRIAEQQESLGSPGVENNLENEDPSVAASAELSTDLLSYAGPDAVASGVLRKSQTNALAAARETRMRLKHQGFLNAAEAFAFADKDKDGLLAAPAVSDWLRELELPDATVASVLEQLARGRVRDGCIDARQWLRVFNHPSWGRLASQDTALRAVANAAAPVGRASIRERVDTRSAIFERRAVLESVGQSFKLELEESKAVSYAANYMTEDDLLVGAQGNLDGGAVLSLAGQECGLRGLTDPADAFWFFADSVDGGAGGQARVNALRRPASDPPSIREGNLARGLAALKITSVDPFELLYALTEHEGGRRLVDPSTFLQQWGGSDGSKVTQKKMHPFAVKASLSSAGRPTRRATIRAAVRKVQELVANRQVCLPTAEELLSRAKDAADGAQSLHEEVEFAAAAAEGVAEKLVEDSYTTAKREVNDADSLQASEEQHSEETRSVHNTSNPDDWRASSPPVWRVVPVTQDQYYGDPIYAPHDPAKYEQQRLADKEKSAQILAQGGAVGTVRVRRRQSHEILTQLRQELKRRGFKDAAEAFVFFDDNTNEVLVPIDFRRAFRRLDLDRSISCDEAFRAIEDPHHQCGAIRFVHGLTWSKRGVPRSIPRALKRAEKRRHEMEDRVQAAVAQLRREISGSMADDLDQRRKAAAEKRRQIRRAGQNAIRIAREGLQDRGFVDCAEAFTFFDTAGDDGGGFLSHVELELGFKNLGLLENVAATQDKVGETEDEEDEEGINLPKRELLNLHELRMALEAGGMFDGQTSYAEFIRHLEWGPLRYRTSHEQNAALDEAMVRRKAIRARVMDIIAQEVAGRQAVLDSRVDAGKQCKLLVKRAFSVAENHADGSKCAELLRAAIDKIEDAAVRCTHPDAAALFDTVLDMIHNVAQVLLKRHVDDHSLAKTAEAAAHESERAEQSAQSVAGVFGVISLVPIVCARVCQLDDNSADEGSEIALKLPATPNSLEEVSKLTSWRLITHPGAGLLRKRLTRARIDAAGQVAVAVGMHAQAAAAASPTRAGQEPGKELALRAWKQALDIDRTNSKAIEQLPAAEVAWQQVLALRTREQEAKAASDRANGWMDVSGMSDYGFFDSEQRKAPSGSEIAARMPGRAESELRDTPIALQPRPPEGSKPKHSVAAEVSGIEA